MSKKNNEMSYYGSDFKVDMRWGVCDDCYSEIEEYGDAIDQDNKPLLEVVLIVNENDGDDHRQLSFDFGEEDIRNKRDDQPYLVSLSIPEFAADFQLCGCGGSLRESVLSSFGFLNEVAFKRDNFVSCSGGVFAEYGSFHGYQDVIDHEVSIEKGNLVRIISSEVWCESERLTPDLIKETYNYKGELVDFYAHPLLEPYIKNHLLTMPEERVTDTSKEVVYEKIDIDELPNASNKVNHERFTIDRQSEWISDVNRDHLYLINDNWYDGVTRGWVTNRLRTKGPSDATPAVPGYDWGNCPNVYCGFVHEFWEGTEILKSRYYVWGGIVTNQPRLNYRKDGRLLNVIVRIDNKDHIMWMGH